MTFVAYQKYAHIYWIPFFPLNKLVYLRCPKCEHTVERTDMTLEEKAAISRPLSKARTPVWTFSAVAVIAAIASIGMFVEHQRLDRTMAYQKDPHAGDLVVVHGKSEPEHPFLVLRVNKIEGESLDLSFSNYSYSTLEGARKDIGERGVVREPSAASGESERAARDDYFGKHAAMAKTTYAKLDVRYVGRPGGD
jgi:hypothetical protein